MKQVLELYERIIDEGRVNSNRTGTDTQRIFGHQMRFNLADGFPLVTTKTVHLKSVIVELLWFLQGRQDVQFLNEHGCKIWDEWALSEADLDKSVTLSVRDRIYIWERTNNDNDVFAFLKFNRLSDEDQHTLLDQDGIPRTKTYRELGRVVGDLGPIYGKQWRSWTCPDGSTIDQIAETVNLLKTKPFSRRIIVSAWNPADLPDESISPQANVFNNKMALAACHTLFQFFADEANNEERLKWLNNKDDDRYVAFDCFQLESEENGTLLTKNEIAKWLDDNNVPKLRLSCQLYQRKQNCALAA